MAITIDYSGKLVLITGGGRGIGWAITKALAKAGADVAITYTSTDPSAAAEALSSEMGVRVIAFRCEVTNSSDVDSMLASVQKTFGRKVDIGVANAGIALWKDAHENTDDEFKRIFEVNTFGPFYLARALMRSWLDLPIPLSSSSSTELDIPSTNLDLSKQILFVSSISGQVAMSPQRQTAYNASKGALTMMSKSLAAEWAHLGVYVNSISPGYVLTDMIANPPDAQAQAWSKEWQDRTPVGKFATPDQVGEFVALLLSDRQGGMGFMAGSDVVLDGGYTLY